MSLLYEGCSYSYSNCQIASIFQFISQVLEVLKFQSRCNGLYFNLAIITIWVNCLTIYPKGAVSMRFSSLAQSQPYSMCCPGWATILFHSTTLHVSSSLSSSLCLPIQLMLLVRQDGSTWIPVLIPSSTFLTQFPSLEYQLSAGVD